jgi:hypothetical protein
MKPETWGVEECVHISRREEISGNTGLLDAVRRVDLKIDEAWENDRNPSEIVVALHGHDASLFDDERSGKWADNWIDEQSL